MDEHCSEHEKLEELVKLHHCALTYLISLVRRKEENEAQFWNSLKTFLEEVEKNGKL